MYMYDIYTVRVLHWLVFPQSEIKCYYALCKSKQRSLNCVYKKSETCFKLTKYKRRLK